MACPLNRPAIGSVSLEKAKQVTAPRRGLYGAERMVFSGLAHSLIPIDPLEKPRTSLSLGRDDGSAADVWMQSRAQIVAPDNPFGIGIPGDTEAEAANTARPGGAGGAAGRLERAARAASEGLERAELAAADGLEKAEPAPPPKGLGSAERAASEGLEDEQAALKGFEKAERGEGLKGVLVVMAGMKLLNGAAMSGPLSRAR